MTASSGTDWARDSCKLPTAERPLRVAEFDSLFATSLRSLDRIDDTRVRMTLTAEPATVRDLTARETECCSFFTFDITELADALQLDVSVPPAYVDVLDGLAQRAASYGE